MPSLDIILNDGKSYNFSLKKGKITIGRGKDNTLVLADKTVSRHHAEIEKTRKGFLLRDLGSYNSTKLNGEPIQNVLLKQGDIIKIGLTDLTFLNTKKDDGVSLENSLILTNGADFAGKNLETPAIFSKSGAYDDSRELLLSPKNMKARKDSGLLKVAAADSRIKAEISSLERSNKVLYILYEISRQMNVIQDLRVLLTQIMDLIFEVIDADYGCLLLTGSESDDKIIPMVVKYKDDSEREKRKLIVSQTIIHKVINDKVAVLSSNAMADSRFDGSKSLAIQKIKSAICVPLWRKDRIIGVIQLDSVRFGNQFTQEDLELLKAIGSQMAMIIEQTSLNEQIREEELMRSRLERFHSPQVIEMILQGSQDAKDNVMEPKDLTATILFSDIVGFTSIAEKISPRETNIILNEYFSKMTDIIFYHDGTLDKYIGDGIMAVFGAPMERKDDAERAILAAKDMIKKVSEMRAEKRRHGAKFDVRIGINTGRVVAGNIGSLKRMDYTVIGDSVNIASRLESIAAPNQILLGEDTYRCVKDNFNIRAIGPKKVKGKVAEILVYEVL